MVLVIAVQGCGETPVEDVSGKSVGGRCRQRVEMQERPDVGLLETGLCGFHVDAFGDHDAGVRPAETVEPDAR